MKKKTKTRIFIVDEHARYEVKAKTSDEAEKKFLKKISCPFPTEVIDRDVWEDDLGKYALGGRSQ